MRKLIDMTHDNDSTIAGTVGGTLLTVIVNMHSTDILKTVILGIVGALTSFTVSVGLKWIQKRIQKFKS
ncbi:MAG: hypothetical protein SFY32_15480 [Bacteroidota bacterium]|nr:hypothetical protein [Bacteroidota bacterium]